MKKSTITLILGLVLLSSMAFATTRLVPDTYATIQSAINASSDYDTVLVSAGTYSENLLFSGKNIVVTSADGAASTIIQAANTGVAVVRMVNGEPRGAEISGFTIKGSNYGGVYCSGSSPTILNNIIEGNKSNNASNGAGIDLNSTSGSLVKNNILRADTAYIYGSAIQSYYSEYDTICYNIIYDCVGVTEIRCVSCVAAIYNNTIDVDGSYCHAISNQISDTIDCRNNIIVNVPDTNLGVDATGVYAANGGCARVAYNCFYNNPNGDYSGAGIVLENGNFSDDPGFTGSPAGTPEEYDLLPPPLSPCVDTGDPNSFFNDFNGTRNDIGWRPWDYYLPVRYVPTQYSNIQDAIDDAVDNDVIVVFPGTYVENLDFLGRDLFIRSDSGATRTTIQAANPNLPTVQMVSGESRAATLYGFTITGSNYCGIYCSNSSPTILNNIIEGNKSNTASNGAGIDLNSTSGMLIKDNILRYDTAYTYGSAIQSYYSENDTICYNLIYDCRGVTEIRCVSCVAAIFNNTIDVADSYCHGISNQVSDTIDCRNNIIVNVPDTNLGVDAVGVYAANGGYAKVAYSDFYNNPNGSTSGPGIVLESGNITSYPLFYATPAGDPDYYDLRPYSPCINAGDPNAFFNDPDGSRNDMGRKPWYISPKLMEFDTDEALPEDYSLAINYPNPFNARTTIQYSIPKDSQVSLDIYDLLGRHVVRLVDTYQNAGIHQVTWDAGELSSGTYFYKVTSDDFNTTNKMILLK